MSDRRGTHAAFGQSFAGHDAPMIAQERALYRTTSALLIEMQRQGSPADQTLSTISLTFTGFAVTEGSSFMEQQQISTNQGLINVRTSGTSGTAIVFVHGNSASSLAYQKQLESSLADHYRLIALDLPGHGSSPAATD